MRGVRHGLYALVVNGEKKVVADSRAELLGYIGPLRTLHRRLVEEAKARGNDAPRPFAVEVVPVLRMAQGYVRAREAA